MGLDRLRICSGLGGKFSLFPAAVNMVIVCSGSVFETIDGGAGVIFEGGRSCCDDILSWRSKDFTRSSKRNLNLCSCIS